ncbi:MAG TPA: efflux transporter outer membrane subunit [Thermoanaerobaculia bacterium]|nr:efflux transporter outer membrane subunit [Thermoanaerobaculia bacterium]
MKRTLASLLALSLAGCAMGPDYKRPETAPPENHRGAAGPATGASLADLAWWDLAKDDQVLVGLLKEALAKNQDLKIAAARVEEARAISRINYVLPQVSAGAGAARGRVSENVGSLAGGQTLNAFELTAAFTWEIDLWGRLRRTNESTLARFLATEEARRGVSLGLVSDVAAAYYQLRSLDMQLEIAQRTVKSRQDSFDLVEKRLRGGIGNKLESSQAASALAQTEIAVPQIEQAIFEQENLISLLLGRNPGPIARGKAIGEMPAVEIPAGLPSALLERRPDVLEAEANLRAANAEVGIAEANLFPQLSLTGSAGFQSTDLSDLLKSPSFVWNIAGGIFAPIFQGGRLRRERDAAHARWDQARLAYEKAALAAFGDTASSLNAIGKTREIREANGRNVDALRDAEKTALLRYDGGVSPYLEVLDAQRELFSGELNYATSLRDQKLAVIRLYRALGGGWNTPEMPPEGQAPATPAPASTSK